MASKCTIRGFSNPFLKVMMEGVYDENCLLSKFNGKWPILQKIWYYVHLNIRESIKDTSDISSKVKFDHGDSVSYLNLNRPIDYECFPFVRGSSYWNDDDYYNYEENVDFPKPCDMNINMMPFILAESFKNSKLPTQLKGYWKMIKICGALDPDQIGKVCYLTVQEGWVRKDKSQRRAGLHTERPGKVELKDGCESTCLRGEAISEVKKNSRYHHWGFGYTLIRKTYEKDRFLIKGGIYMASTVNNSCRVWNCEIVDDGVIGQHGNIEHLRNLLPDSSENMNAKNLYWLSDRTPHESLPMKERKYRQYFRLVTSQVSLWFEDHSTKNPEGVVPDKNITKIVKGNKFKKGEAYIALDELE